MRLRANFLLLGATTNSEAAAGRRHRGICGCARTDTTLAGSAPGPLRHIPRLKMSAMGQERTCVATMRVSVKGSEADIADRHAD